MRFKVVFFINQTFKIVVIINDLYSANKRNRSVKESKCTIHPPPSFILILEGLSVEFVVGISLGCVAAVGAICGVVAALVIYV